MEHPFDLEAFAKFHNIENPCHLFVILVLLSRSYYFNPKLEMKKEVYVICD